MKVIVAAMMKTGTKSMNAALTHLGYKVYDFLEHPYYHSTQWDKILETGGGVELFQQMYKHVDAVVDIPPCFFWEQIHDAFPDAKIILLTRDEDAWYKSLMSQLREFNQWSLFKLATLLTPAGRTYQRIMINSVTVGFGTTMTNPLATLNANEMVLRMKYRQHNCYVKQRAPWDKLLVMDISEGWQPLCDFLGVEVPDVPFPHRNKGGKAFEEAVDKPMMVKIIRQTYVALAVTAVIAYFVLYVIYYRL